MPTSAPAIAPTLAPMAAPPRAVASAPAATNGPTPGSQGTDADQPTTQAAQYAAGDRTSCRTGAGPSASFLGHVVAALLVGRQDADRVWSKPGGLESFDSTACLVEVV